MHRFIFQVVVFGELVHIEEPTIEERQLFWLCPTELTVRRRAEIAAYVGQVRYLVSEKDARFLRGAGIVPPANFLEATP